MPAVERRATPRTPQRRAERPAPSAPAPRPNDAPGLPPVVSDDRDQLSPTERLILVIEATSGSPAILKDLAHEMGFQCIVTHGADEGVRAALRYRPSAILLDMNLPDYSASACWTS